MRDAIILIAAMALSFWVGDSWGLKRAPEYVDMKERAAARLDAEMAALDMEYYGSADEACDRMIDLARDHLSEPITPPPDPRDR